MSEICEEDVQLQVISPVFVHRKLLTVPGLHYEKHSVINEYLYPIYLTDMGVGYGSVCVCVCV